MGMVEELKALLEIEEGMKEFTDDKDKLKIHII